MLCESHWDRVAYTADNRNEWDNSADERHDARHDAERKHLNQKECEVANTGNAPTEQAWWRLAQL